IRTQNVPGYKLTDNYEIESEKLQYFVDNKTALENEFFEKLSGRISESRAKLFCSLISELWHDGKTKRSSIDVLKLFASIKNYLLEYRIASCEENIRVLNEIDENIEFNFDDDEIKAIIDLNQEMIEFHCQKWIETRSDYLEITCETIHCRRGLYLREIFPEK